MQKFAEKLIRQHGIYENFYIADLSILQNKINEWRQYLPKVTPFYAVKCNPDTEMLKVMISNKIGFDCASQHEIKTVLDLGCKPENILFMHPFKTRKDIKYAISRNIKYTTFDSISEMNKIKQDAPSMQCLVRLKINNPSARVQLGLKYGIDRQDYKQYIDMAKDLNLNIVGVCYHVGSASKDPEIFKDGMDYSRDVFAYAKQKGFLMSVLDIGGGFMTENFKDCAKIINKELETFDESVKVFAEPGRYFASDVFTFFSPVIGYKYKNNKHEYYIGDGLYGSFNCILYDGQCPEITHLYNPLNDDLMEDKDELYESICQGSTCDANDKVGNVKLPKLRLYDYIACKNFGAYTISGAKDFNGIPMSTPLIFYTN